MEIFILVTFTFVAILSATQSSTTKVTLLPDDKENSKIIVLNDSGSQVVDEQGFAVIVTSDVDTPTTPEQVDLEKIKLQHATLFAIQPKKPDKFLLYFENNGAVLLNESKLLISTIIEAAKTREAPILNIIGHSDAAGSTEYNLRLSTERANSVAKLLQSKNIKGAEYRIDSYGENDPLIKSDKEIEPQNRRVEVEIW
ncbi:OmpA family protein [Psychromonas arctica]|uniref:OmpA family protein n=1 Tax=Psychromonas arctica TaxID=168275 RepID=UPI002FCFC6F8